MTDKEILKALGEELKTALIINHRFEESNDTENPDDHRFIALLSRTIDLISHQQAEIERLEKIRKADNNLITSLNKCYKTAKAEAYKEFAEKLKEKCYEDFQETDEMLSPYVTDDDIDNLLKEMEGEE